MARRRKLDMIYADDQRREDYRYGFHQGIIAAAFFMEEHRASANGFRLADLMLCKFNMTKKKPRLERTKAVDNDNL